jgi:hypothetical protein
VQKLHLEVRDRKGRPRNEITVEPKTEISVSRREINQYFFVGSHFSILSGLAVRANDLGLGRKRGGRPPDWGMMEVHAAPFGDYKEPDVIRFHGSWEIIFK